MLPVVLGRLSHVAEPGVWSSSLLQQADHHPDGHISSSQMSHAGRHLFFSQRCASFASPDKDFETLCPKLCIKNVINLINNTLLAAFHTRRNSRCDIIWMVITCQSCGNLPQLVRNPLYPCGLKKSQGLGLGCPMLAFAHGPSDLCTSCITALLKHWKRRSILFSICLSSSLSTISTCTRDMRFTPLTRAG